MLSVLSIAFVLVSCICVC